MSDRIELTKLIIAIQRKIDAENLKISLGIAPEDTAEKAQAEEKRRQCEAELGFIKEQLAAIDGPKTDGAQNKIPWLGSDADFAALIVALWNKGYIDADSQTAALNKAIPHFSGINPNARVLNQGLSQRAYLGARTQKTRNFECIPPSKKHSKKEAENIE